MAGDFEHGKRELHQLVDQLPLEQVTAALRLMRDLRVDPVLFSILNAPADDEPYTDAQRRRETEAEASISRGEGISQQEILREFGL
jgi:hypothetical protein